MTRPHRPDHDDERLRDLLADAVADIWPADRLAAITARTRERAGGRESTVRNRSLAVAGAVVTSAAVITAAAWAGGAFDPSPDEPPRAATDTSSTAPSTGPVPTTEPTPDPLESRGGRAEPSATATPTPTPVPQETGGTSPDPDRAPAGPKVAGIYFTGDGPDGPRLFREFQQVPAGMPEALTISIEGRAQDPDYGTAWDGIVTRVAGYNGPDAGGGGTHSVVFPADAGDLSTRPEGMSEREARMAVQQLVRTVQAYAQNRAGVAFYAEGVDRPLGTLLGIRANGDQPGQFVAAPGLEVLNHVSISNPAEGATVGDTLEANGRASSFEATVPWQIRRGGRVVTEGSVMAEGWMGRLYPWRTRIDVSGLSPGIYTFVAMTSDPSGGAEGPGPHTDTRTFRVR